MAWLKAEADAPVVEEYPEFWEGHVAAEPVGVGLYERDGHAFAVDSAQVHGVAVVPGIAERRNPVGVDGSTPGIQAGGVDQGLAVGVFVEHGGSVMAGLSCRLDH